MDEKLIDQLHDLTYRNMTSIIPSSISKQEDYLLWRKSFDNNATIGTQHIIDLKDDVLRGYLSFTVRDSSKDIFINEVQIDPKYQGNGVTIGRLLLNFLREIQDCKFSIIRTYANNLNKRSQQLLQKIGFEVEGTTEKGIRFKISKEKLLIRYRNRLQRAEIDYGV